MNETKSVIPSERIQQSIHVLRGHKVILDSELAALYGVKTKALVQAVKRNLDRFPTDFMFKLSADELISLRSQFVTLKKGRGEHRKFAPYAFTEQGVAMLSSVLRSPRAVQVNIEIMRTFVRLRTFALSHDELKKYDEFRAVFEAIRKLIDPDNPPPTPTAGFAR